MKELRCCSPDYRHRIWVWIDRAGKLVATMHLRDHEIVAAIDHRDGTFWEAD